MERSSVDLVVDSFADGSFRVEPANAVRYDAEADFHFRLPVIGFAHRSSEIRRQLHRKPSVHPDHQPSKKCRLRVMNSQVGIVLQCRLHVGHLGGPVVEFGSFQVSVDGFAGDVVPVGAGLVVDQQDEPVIETTGAEMVDFPSDHWRQTDAAVADRSERDKIRFTGKFALSNMVIHHLFLQQGTSLTGPLEDEKLFFGFQVGFVQRNSIAGDVESLERVWTFEHRPVGIEHHFNDRNLLLIATKNPKKSPGESPFSPPSRAPSRYRTGKWASPPSFWVDNIR